MSTSSKKSPDTLSDGSKEKPTSTSPATTQSILNPWIFNVGAALQINDVIKAREIVELARTFGECPAVLHALNAMVDRWRK